VRLVAFLLRGPGEELAVPGPSFCVDTSLSILEAAVCSAGLELLVSVLTLFCRETAAFGLESGAETLPFASEIAGAPFAGFVVCS
jgi:hypothetical protein